MMVRRLRLPRSDRPRHGEAGVALIEVIVSTAVLALVALGVLAGIDAAGRSTGREKARAVAVNLAEQDQERLRALPVSELATYAAAPRTVPVDGINYTVTSTTVWVRDDTGKNASCTNDSRDADYLHISSTVTSQVVGVRTAPVRMDSIVAPSVEYGATRGTLGVKLVDHDGHGVANKLVSIAGPDVDSAQTDSDGCALFQYIKVGAYTVDVNATGMVDHAGITHVTRSPSVTAGMLTVVSIDYDAAATVSATVKTLVPGTSTEIESKATQVAAENGGEIGLLRRFPDNPVTATSSFTADHLFPFSTPYAFFTGRCTYSSPTYDSRNSGYFESIYPAQQVQAGVAPTVTIRQPPLNLRFTKNYSGGSPANGMTVKAYPQQPADESCVEPTISLKTFTVGSQAGYVGRSQTGGQLEAGVPFGTYDVCLQDGGRRWTYPDYDNTKPAGSAALVTAVSSSGWQSGACP